jgi:uncharacterized phage infection (PIP) family protein YhgE
MKKILLLLFLSFFLFSCKDNTQEKKPETSTQDDTKKKELELKEKELDIKEKQLQKDKEIAEKEKQLSEKEKQLEDKEQKQKNQPPDSQRKTDYAGVPGSYPEGSKRYLNYDDIYGKTKWQLRVMRNEIFARHGYIFQSSDLRKYFSRQTWYDAQYNDVTNVLSEIEKYNVNYIKGYE